MRVGRSFQRGTLHFRHPRLRGRWTARIEPALLGGDRRDRSQLGSCDRGPSLAQGEQRRPCITLPARSRPTPAEPTCPAAFLLVSVPWISTMRNQESSTIKGSAGRGET